MRYRTTILGVIAILIVATGCGTSDEQQANNVARSFVKATNDADYAKVCGLLSSDFKKQLGVTSEDCATRITKEFGETPAGSTLALTKVRVHDGRASAQIDVSKDSEPPSPLSLVLVHEGDKWRIAGRN